jgi:hypothetical protein
MEMNDPPTPFQYNRYFLKSTKITVTVYHNPLQKKLYHPSAGNNIMDFGLSSGIFTEADD